MSRVVLDASAVMGWCFEDEADPEGDALLRRVAASGAVVPGLLALEVANVLVGAERRGRMNPRLDPAWLEYVVPIGAFERPDGWRWKIDPSMRMGGFGPWRPEWSMARLPSLGMPVLCVLGLDIEVMGWGTLPEDVLANLPANARFVPLDGVGHFVHIERPDIVAELILDVIT